MDNLLNRLYYTPGTPAAYGSVVRLWKAAKLMSPKIKKKDVQAWLMAQDTYTLHKQARKHLTYEPRVYVSRIDQQWAVDLCDTKNISQYNDGCNFILTCIDVLSKWADAEPVPRKTATATSAAFEAILNRTRRRPERVESDQGKEFYNSTFSDLCKREGIHHFSSQSSHKACVVERFNRSLKDLMYRHFTAQNTYRWKEVLPDLLKTYNNRYHRSIKMTPNQVNANNELAVYRTLYRKKPKSGKRLQSGNLVRISRKRHIFEKGYLPNFTEEIFKVTKVLSNHTPNRYELEDLSGEAIKGRFAPEEIQKVIKGDDDLWKIERIIRTVKRKDGAYHFVKWRGFPDKFNSLIAANDIINLNG